MVPTIFPQALDGLRVVLPLVLLRGIGSGENFQGEVKTFLRPHGDADLCMKLPQTFVLQSHFLLLCCSDKQQKSGTVLQVCVMH